MAKRNFRICKIMDALNVEKSNKKQEDCPPYDLTLPVATEQNKYNISDSSHFYHLDKDSGKLSTNFRETDFSLATNVNSENLNSLREGNSTTTHNNLAACNSPSPIIVSNEGNPEDIHQNSPTCSLPPALKNKNKNISDSINLDCLGGESDNISTSSQGRDFSPATDDEEYIPKSKRRRRSSTKSLSSTSTSSSSSSSTSSSSISSSSSTSLLSPRETSPSILHVIPEPFHNTMPIKNKQKGLNKKKETQKLRNLGLPYTSCSNSKKLIEGRKMGMPCSEKCRLQCRANIIEYDREKIFKEYWGMASLQRQRNFIDKNMLEIKPKYQYKSQDKSRKPKNAFYFEVNNTKIRICKTFFKNTLGINDRPIRTVLEKRNERGILAEEGRGKHGKHKHVRGDLLAGVRRHIESIPRIESHYLRKQTTREFIDGGKTLTDLYRDYKEDCESMNAQYVAIHIYRKIFKEEYNISFFVPKKDQCALCSSYKNLSENEKHLLRDKYERHLLEKEKSRKEKQEDKEKSCDNYLVACYDLQAVLPIPRGEVSVFYYRSKLNCYNFTISELAKDHTECYFWSEIEGQRGANEIGTNVLKYLQKMSSICNDKHYIFYSDNCCGQQKNQFVISMYIYAVKNYPIKSITHKYLITGHTQNEGDAVHSTIEREIKKNLKSGPIYVPDQYISAIQHAKKKGNPYIVNVMGHKDFYDIKLLTDAVYKADCGEKIKLSELKIIKIEKSEGNNVRMSFKKSYLDESFSAISLGKVTRSRATNPELKPLYSKRLPLSDRKKKDLAYLIEQKHIPEYYVSSYYGTVLSVC